MKKTHTERHTKTKKSIHRHVCRGAYEILARQM